QFREQPEPYLRGFVDARGAAWLIYPTVEASWLYLVGVQRLGTFWAGVVAVIAAITIGWWMARRHSAAQAAIQAPAAATGSTGGRCRWCPRLRAVCPVGSAARARSAARRRPDSASCAGHRQRQSRRSAPAARRPSSGRASALTRAAAQSATRASRRSAL